MRAHAYYKGVCLEMEKEGGGASSGRQKMKKWWEESKAYGEKFIFFYSIIWVTVLAFIVIWSVYEYFTPNDYVLLGLNIAIPCFAGPLLFPSESERKIPIFERYIIKANIFIFIIGYIGNHFYTHYFYEVLGMRYTGPLGPGKGLEINKVPISMFLCTHPYFMTYHVLATPILRVVKSRLQHWQWKNSLFAVAVLSMAFTTAFVETWTISGFPYYTYPNLYDMLTKGSAFYGIFFVVTYPWFFRLDEAGPWPLSRVILEALAAMMVVLLCADFFKLLVGPI